MFTTILTVHILGAIVVGAVTLLTLFSVSAENVVRLHGRVRALALGLFFEIGTGSLLAILSPGISLFAFCKNIMLYSTVVFATYVVVFLRLSRMGRAEVFPKRFVALSTIGALIIG